MFDQVLNTHLNAATKGVIEKLKLEKFLYLLQILYTDHKFITGSVTWAYSSVDNRLWKRTSQKRVECFSKTSQQTFVLMKTS